MSMLSVTKQPLSWYVDRIDQQRPFVLSRYGDGEFMAMLGMRGANCDGHVFFAQMGQELTAALKDYAGHDEDFIFATSPIARRTLGKEIERFLSSLGVKLHAHHTGTLTEASLSGELSPLVSGLAKRKTLYVGPARLKQFVTHHFAADFVEIPLQNCYLKMTPTLVDIYRKLDTGRFDVVAFSASMAANVMVARIWKQYYQRVTLLDLGSLFDFYATGIATRSYMNKIEIDRLLYANFPRAETAVGVGG